ncbi:hypothetical protein [Streptomyces sp. H34-S4]|nr:hypothetical protein [Streptomyces sp. H34-S4]MCY0935963.1 hypothetical protein [Streptomyces sp. H34-S4]
MSRRPGSSTWTTEVPAATLSDTAFLTVAEVARVMRVPKMTVNRRRG